MINMEKQDYYVFTDGACRAKLLGGYGGVIFDLNNRSLVEFAHYQEHTTNNRMELQAVITALQKLPQKSKITVFADSSYVTNAFNKGWIYKWRAKDYCGRQNADLWRILEQLVHKRVVTFVWIRGHKGFLFNTRADFLARHASENILLARTTPIYLTDTEFKTIYHYIYTELEQYITK